ncbi:MAG: sigma-70 family RNA polymerase sigma factor [Actinomycetota bacterium]
MRRFEFSSRRGSADSQSIPTWEEIAHSHDRFLYSLAYRLCGNHQDAQDLVQEVLLRVRRGLNSYRPGNLEGWLSRITTNVFLDQVRRRKRRPTVPLPDDPDRVLVGTPDVDADLAARDLPDHLQALLMDLQPEYRVAVVLKDVLSFSYEEIADMVDAPIGTVRSRIHRGRGKLREALAS